MAGEKGGVPACPGLAAVGYRVTGRGAASSWSKEAVVTGDRVLAEGRGPALDTFSLKCRDVGKKGVRAV